MKRFALTCKIEFLLLVRNFFGFFFGLVFPLMMLILFGSIYGNSPMPGSGLGTMDLSVPGYSVMVMGVAGLMSFPLTLAEYKERKIYKRFDATPVGKKHVILAQITVNLLLTVLGIAILLIAGRFIYQVRIQGDAFSVAVAGLLSIAAMFSMGFLSTAIGRDAKITNLLCYIFYFIMIFLSGATYPDMLFPESVRNVSKLLPMTYAVDLMQGVFAGDGLGAYRSELLILGGVTLAFTAIGAILYRKQDWS
ncbi:MAG: ABC transporter permease [Oscillospiraceae bacterium]|nr:ABC transporter permease [Oscillospiraceae bacterium]